MKKRLLVLFLLLLSTPLHADNRIYEKQVIIDKVTSIYDADTFRADIKGWPDIVGKRVPIRVLGVDAPEIRGKCEIEKKKARAAKQYTVAKLRAAKRVELRNIQRGKYFRLLADVYVDNQNLAKLLIKDGHARPYDGGTRKGWCS